MTKKIFLIAGEVSGDLLGGALMHDIKTLDEGKDVSFSGVGGATMQAEGLDSLFPMSDLSVMGLAEVVRHFPRLHKRFHQTVKAVMAENPDVLVTIDAPDFGLRVAKKIKKLRPSIRCVHYVAPTVWAWRAGRAKKIAAFLDGLMCLFPFEPKYFTPHGLEARFVGHPLSRLVPKQFDTDAFRASKNLDVAKPLLCLLPGSRVREIEALVPVMRETIGRIRKVMPELQVIVPTLPHLVGRLGALADVATVFVPRDDQEKYTCFAASNVALHASGTVALEIALCGTPMVTLYKMAPLTAWVAKRMLKTPYANLVNILLQHPVVPELLQDDCNADQATAMVLALLRNDALAQLQCDGLTQVADFLQEDEPQSAARFVLSYTKTAA